MINPQQRASDNTSAIVPADSLLDANIALKSKQQAENSSAMQRDGIIGINTDGSISFINKTAGIITGWLQADIKNQNFETIFQLSEKYLIKVNLELIQSVIKSGHMFGPITKHTIKTKNNDEYLIDFSISPLSKDSVVLMFHDSIKKNQSPRSLLYQVNHDPLTRLENRNSIQASLAQLHEDYRASNKTYSILLLDVDRFKLINDCYGHKTGDQLLQLIAERIQHHLRAKDKVGRWAGEEFACILPDTDIKKACSIAKRICQDISLQPFLTDSQKIAITASIGVANFPLDGDKTNELFRLADATLYQAKKCGRNRIHSSQQVLDNVYSTASQLEKALNEDRITPVFQSIFELSSGKQVAEEALARIEDKDGQLIEANEFIDAAVEFQMVHRIDYQIIKKMISRCTENYLEAQNHIPRFVNVSADLLRHPKLVDEIIQFAKKKCNECGQDQCDVKPIVIEITEQELLGDVTEVKSLLGPFIDFGMPLAIDDFGSGYSSLTYLADLPISYLKFDGDLIKRVAYEDRARKIINGVQKMAESLELVTIAEHIEDQETLNVLRELGVSWGQGYFAAKPSK